MVKFIILNFPFSLQINAERSVDDIFGDVCLALDILK